MEGSMRNTIVLLFSMFSLGLAGGPAQADVSKLPPEARRAILSYRLTTRRSNQLISAMDAMTKYLVSLPDAQDRMAAWMKMTPPERIANLEKDPRAMSILRKNRLTPKEYLVGVPTLRMALMAAQGAPSPPVIASPANVAFAKTNLAQLKPKWDAAEGIGAQK